MKSKFNLALIIFFSAVFICSGCDYLGDIGENIEELIYGEEEKDDGPPRPFTYIEAMSTDDFGVIIDPYDGSLDIIDPLLKSRYSIHTTWDSRHGVVFEEGKRIAVLDTFRHEVRIVNISQTYTVEQVIEVGETVNKLIVSPYDNFILAIYDPEEGGVSFGDSGMINYFEVDIIKVSNGETKTLSIDFSPDRIVFSPNQNFCLLGKEIRLIYLNLETASTVSYPLSLGTQDPKTPRIIRISPDGQFAMALVEGTSDVYVIDLDIEFINIFDMTSEASDIIFIPNTRIALLPKPENASIAVIDLDEAVPDEIDVGFRVSNAVISPDKKKVLFFNEGGNVGVVMNIEDFETRAYQLNIVIDDGNEKPVDWSPDSSKIILVGEPGYGTYGYYDVDIIDLESRRVVPLGFESEINDYLFSPNQNTLGVLLNGVQKFVLVDLDLLQAESWDIGRKSRDLHYLKASSTFMIGYYMGRGKLSFIGDQGTDLHWIAARFLDN